MSEYKCTLCPRNCNAIRTEEEGRGYCRCPSDPKIARAALHRWEEPCISGTKGSGTIFFSGCVLSCVFCQNSKISTEGYGKTIGEDSLINIIKRLEEEGAHNINLVSPTPYVESIIRCFERYKPGIPVVYNTGGYEKAETIRRLEGIVDIYLPDMKYVSSSVSGKYSGAENYFEYASQAIKEMIRQTGAPVYDESGLMKRGTLIRHLILPLNTSNSIAVLDWIAAEFGTAIPVSLMGQYVPLGRAGDYKEINRTITKREYKKVLEHLYSLELDGYMQELTAAAKDYVPDFDVSTLQE